MKVLRFIAAWLAGFLLVLWRTTCRYPRMPDDPRPGFRANKTRYVYALLHAHQLAAVFRADDSIAAMVSRSADGDLLVPSMILRGIIPVRGSSRKGNKDKGGRQALTRLTDIVRDFTPALLAVDGPRGPRNHVHKGVAELAMNTGAVVLPICVVPSRRWILRGTWDHMQIPKPFSRIPLHFAPALAAEPGEDVNTFRLRIKDALDALERRYDPTEHPTTSRGSHA